MTTFSPTSAEPSANPETVGWARAVSQGFHGDRMSDEALARRVGYLFTDQALLRAVYDRDLPELADPGRPVATFSSYHGTINVGAGTLLPARLITDVTVRPSHRRRGLLRKMMTAELRDAADNGLAVAALTVTEGGIYRRFGFGPATFEAQVRVHTGARFSLHNPPSSGNVVIVDAAVLERHVSSIFERYHQSVIGSVSRFGAVPAHVSGSWDEHEREQNRQIRGAIFVDDAGESQGYVSWRADRKPETFGMITIQDLVATSTEAYLALWDFLGHVDLIDEVNWNSAPAEDPLRFALTEPNLYQVRRLPANVWLRVLDLRAALQARAWISTGSTVIEVRDSQELVAGRYLISVENGQAEVDRTEEPAEVLLDVASLGSIMLGGVRPSILAGAGLLTEARAGAATDLDQLFAPAAPVWGVTHF